MIVTPPQKYTIFPSLTTPTPDFMINTEKHHKQTPKNKQLNDRDKHMINATPGENTTKEPRWSRTRVRSYDYFV